MGAKSAVATVAWLATDHQQLMYLLSPEGKTVFYIPGVEVVHKVSTPINLPEESNKIKMEPGKMQPPPGGSRKRAAGRTLEVHRTLPEPHRSLDVHKSLPEAQQNQGIPLSVQASSHSRPASGASGSYDSETYQVPDGVKIKDEPDDHLSLSGSDYGSEGMKSPPMNTTGMSPIDMETQEKIKLDRNRQRNRLAASKCRKRKLERISQLDDRVSALKNENADLAAVVKKMKAGVALLKQEVIEHVNSGCDNF